ncbi:enoyl-CoA hydratase/isomerase family protein [Roseospira marina]|uniref:3-hydroxyisobutyryl-CoA hydrolase n=1 Tax=Roseospira marina TaxID=140057 RepID=A0A5M6I8X7_9PROT|nr:enoyl-CoA hydratase/isomerase family protein [Roseospira marina]KAA5604148.1 enoyl-CoA hydratase/isomerase family protein [Roseospira marina]MBB4315755.1 enoyl-CoA hydratase [Roseospira marina]MBB5088922.1 enoyl-CoA hydratase [Roseospira marina]
MSEPEILFDVLGGIGRIRLNRPRALNALTLSKIRAMDTTLRTWATDPAVKAVVVEGAGDRAFCAGGDIRVLAEAARTGDDATIRGFFREEYTLDRLIKTYPKPVLPFLNGIVMGGGVGISVHGRYRIVTENTVFAMPETGIGLFPDVGGTYFLPRCPGWVGTWLALTGERLKAADCLYAGIATHVVPAAHLDALEAALRDATAEAETPEAADDVVAAVLDRFHEDPGPAPLAPHRAAIDAVFGLDSVEAMLAALDRQAADTGEESWAARTAAILRQKAPTSLKVTLRQMRLGADLDFDAAMQTEFRLACRFLRAPDFVEGVRATLVDKDNRPRWTPATLEAVDATTVDGFFAPLDDREALTFPD